MLAGLAGYVDSLGFLHLGGVFVSFMSGNTTRLAVNLAEGRWLAAGAVAGVLLLFVLGAMLGALVAGGEGARSRSRVGVDAAGCTPCGPRPRSASAGSPPGRGAPPRALYSAT